MTGRNCALCQGVGHNMTTCVHLMFHQNKAHCEYLDIWQMWIQTVLFSNLSSQELVRYQYNYIIDFTYFKFFRNLISQTVINCQTNLKGD